MRTIAKIIVPAAVLAAAGVAAGPALAGEMPAKTEALMKAGERAYARECVMCHGATGAANGLGAHIVSPRPRNFELGVYKLRSTPNGVPPTTQDLFNVITNGIPNSTMPSFKELPEQERWGLVHVVLRLGGLDRETQKSISVPAEPPVTPEGVARGKQLYVKLKCDTCHGSTGRGDGPSSLTLKNDAKERIYPADLTTGVFKGGSTAKDLYTRIATGMDGSPMPSYAAEAKPAEIWDLIHYIKTLVK
jgi:cytochrome c oxidase cbb3-type subunit 2